MSDTVRALTIPRIGRMGCNPANFAYHIGTGPWSRGYAVYYAVSSRTRVHEIPDNVTTKYQDDVL